MTKLELQEALAIIRVIGFWIKQMKNIIKQKENLKITEEGVEQINKDIIFFKRIKEKYSRIYSEALFPLNNIIDDEN